MLDGVELREVSSGIQFQGVQTKAQAPNVVGALGFPKTHPMLEHFKFLKAHTSATPKMTIPSPSVLYFRVGSVNTKLYPDREALFAALSNLYIQAVQAFYEAGCRYLQFDDTAWAYLCSKDEVEKAKQRGHRYCRVAPGLCPHDQSRARGKTKGHDDHYAYLPRQFPLHLDHLRRLRAGRRSALRRDRL
jgi:methionine synthase II (cobalamin-independent)